MRTIPTQNTRAAAAGCPVTHTDYRAELPVFRHFHQLDTDRERSDFLFNDSTKDPFFMLQRYDHVLEALQMPELFSSDVVDALDPFRPDRLIPTGLNPPEHTRVRRALNRWFAPAALREIEPILTARCRHLIAELEPLGHCELMAGFALRFPTDVLLMVLGLPWQDGAAFSDWAAALFEGLHGGPDPQPALEAVTEYFQEAIAARLADPRDPEFDMLTGLLPRTPDGEGLSQVDLLATCVTLVRSGVDTVRAALGFMLAYLSSEDGLRHLLARSPDLVPAAVEEFLRLYPLVMQEGRLVQHDTVFHGLELKKGDVLWLGVGSANRDPRVFPDPDLFDLDRPNLDRHLGFGAGPHRCLGMHLVRAELTLAVREWLRAIPEYAVSEGAELRERGGAPALVSLPLEWTPRVRVPQTRPPTR